MTRHYTQQPKRIKHVLLDSIIDHIGAKSDSNLAYRLEVAPPVISKIRHGTLPVGATILLRMHELTGLSINDLRKLGGLPRFLKS